MRPSFLKAFKPSHRLPPQENDRLSQLIPLVGYVFVGLSLLDVATILIPPHFTNALWEFEAIGQLVERLMFPLLGFLLVFYPRSRPMAKIEIRILKILSWGCIVWGMSYLLMVPSIIHNTFRIQAQNATRIEQQTQQHLQGVITLEEQITRNPKDPQVQTLLQQILSQNPNLSSPEQVKSQLVDQLNAVKQQTQAEAQTLQQRSRKSLLKNALKWALGATIGGLAFLRIWSLSQGLRSFPLTKPSVAQVQQASQPSQDQHADG